MSSNVSSIAITGFVLGWSVAWPPGPINAEAVRRGLARRLWPAYAVVIGGCVGDALWAVLVGLGAGALLRYAGLQDVVGGISALLLVILGVLFLRGAWRRYADQRSGEPDRQRAPSSRGSFLLGFTLAITGPWNLAFWLAVMGQGGQAVQAFPGSLVMAAGVLLGAATWGLILCVGVTQLGVRFGRPSWEIFTQFATGALMIFFAVRTTIRLLGA
jgi:threonine/homoserine/homoserine lactone efflux protein